MFKRNERPISEEEQKEREARAGFRVAIFGGTNPRNKDAIRSAKRLTHDIADSDGFSIITGANDTGVPAAAMKEAHRIAQRKKRPDLEPRGIALGPTKLPGAIEVDPQNRTHRLIDESSAMVVLDGSAGTQHELETALKRKERIDANKPIIIFDSTGKHLEHIRGMLLSHQITDHMLSYVYVVGRIKDVRKILGLYYQIKKDPQVSLGRGDRTFLQQKSASQAILA